MYYILCLLWQSQMKLKFNFFLPQYFKDFFFFFYADLIKLFHVVHRISSNWFFLFFTLGQVCHHTDCQSQNKMNPIALCIDCDQHNHQHGEFATHLRFDLAKTSTINLHRKTSIRSNNSDSGTEDDNDPAYSL